ncbi:MAG: uracil-DNA glycosylase [Nitrospiraceae bacterium]|nr:uracil-DNA glycosylase [Nitrospiraceae bacterium]
MGKQVTKKDIKTVLEFYGALGVDAVPAPEKRPVRKKKNSHAAINQTGITRGVSAPDKEAALRKLREEIGECRGCKLAGGRTNLVFGEGNPDARLMFIGEAPGREEDKQGRPFVGDAGKLLTSFIERMGFKREDVFIANIAKCRPPMNRAPEEDEVKACIPFLKKQIEIISPQAIMALGSVSAQNLLCTKTAISALRGKRFEFNGIPLVPTFHPAFLLRNPSRKWDTLEDALPVLEILGESEKAEGVRAMLKKSGRKNSGGAAG